MKVITSETPYKLAEIIQDTWPQLYRPGKPLYNERPRSETNDGEKEHKC